MTRMRRLFLVAILLIPLHIVEQLLFGIDELYELQDMMGTVMAWSADQDDPIVVCVGVAVTGVLALCYGFMTEGLPRLAAASFFGIEFMGESHHIIKTIVRGAYFPGAVTAIALAVLGALIIAEVVRERRRL